VCLVAILTTRLTVLSATEYFIGVYLFFTVHTEVVAVLVECPYTRGDKTPFPHGSFLFFHFVFPF
jgi:hypothetical protein